MDLEREERERASSPKPNRQVSGLDKLGTTPKPDIVEPRPKMRRFYGNAKLDPMRVGKNAGDIAEAVVQYLALEKDARVTITIEIEAEIPEGAL